MYNWISSGDGRHFAESLSEFNLLREQIEEINKNLNRIYNLCLIYDSKEHKGTMKSTHEIRERYEDLGILLPEEECEYKAGAHLQMFAALLIADKAQSGKELSELEKKVLNDMKEKIEQQNVLTEATKIIKTKK